MVKKQNEYLEMRKAALSTLDSTKFFELILKQMNYQRMKGVDLIDDLDKLVNWYLWLCKKYPAPDEVVEKEHVTKAEEKPKADVTPTTTKSESSKKTEGDDKKTTVTKKPSKKK